MRLQYFEQQVNRLARFSKGRDRRVHTYTHECAYYTELGFHFFASVLYCSVNEYILNYTVLFSALQRPCLTFNIRLLFILFFTVLENAAVADARRILSKTV